MVDKTLQDKANEVFAAKLQKKLEAHNTKLPAHKKIDVGQVTEKFCTYWPKAIAFVQKVAPFASWLGAGTAVVVAGVEAAMETVNEVFVPLVCGTPAKLDREASFADE
jgi:homoserine kinase